MAGLAWPDILKSPELSNWVKLPLGLLFCAQEPPGTLQSCVIAVDAEAVDTFFACGSVFGDASLLVEQVLPSPVQPILLVLLSIAVAAGGCLST